MNQSGRIFYVSGEGDDSNSGLTVGAAFRTLQRAADLTEPGDTVLVMNGTYNQPDPNQNILSIRNSGTPDQWITYQAFPGHKPKLQARNWHAINVLGASYIVIDGFEMQGNRAEVTLSQAIAQKNNLNNPITSGNGIGITPDNGNNPHHVIVRNNEVYDFNGGGIYTFRADYITVENNEVYRSAWHSPYGNSGISFYQSWDSDNSTSYKMIVRNNLVYDNQNLVPFFSAGEITDGNGIIVDDHRQTQLDSPLSPYQGRTLIANNVVHNNGGRGIHVFESDRVDIAYNTTYQNSLHPEVSGGEITALFASDVGIYNNILYAENGGRVTTFRETNRLTFDGNLLFNSDRFNAPNGTNLIGQDPQFVAPESGDFRLRSTSPAIGFGTNFGGIGNEFNDNRPIGAHITDVSIQPSTIGEYGLLASSVGASAATQDSDRIVGTLDADRINGLDGNDVIFGNAGQDRISGGDGNDMLVGGSSNDVLYGNGGRDCLFGDSGDDTLLGGADNDVLLGYTGRDRLFGEDGSDRLWGGSSNDTVQGDAGSDRLYGEAGNDKLYGGTEDDLLVGDRGSDRLDGGAGNDRLQGGDDRDTLLGGDGNDRLDGGKGDDVITTGSGNDIIVLRRREGFDRVTDFQNNRDKIDLSGISFSDLSIVQSRTDVLIRLDSTNFLRLEDTRLAEINASDFI